MNVTSKNEDPRDLARRYLLGLLGVDGQESVEIRMLSDARFLEEMEISEDELIDDYLGGELSPPERESFERYFLAAPDHRLRLRQGQALRRYIDLKQRSNVIQFEAPPRVRIDYRRASLALAAMLIVTLAATTYLLVRESRNQPELVATPGRTQGPAPGDQPSSPSAAGMDELLAQRDALAAEVANLAARQKSPGTVISFQLLPGLLRSTSTNNLRKIELPPNAALAAFKLELLDLSADTYRARLIRDAGAAAFEQNGLRAEQTHVTFTVPAVLLVPGPHRIELEGLSPSGLGEFSRSYHFQISRRTTP